MIKHFCDLCRNEITSMGYGAEQVKYTVSVSSKNYGAAYEYIHCVCSGCASVIMDTISKLRVEES
ncbi:MAG: hypothetical protein WC455_16775 [Dehalococcoidia bacterium]|jgi:hypothetical protein